MINRKTVLVTAISGLIAILSSVAITDQSAKSETSTRATTITNIIICDFSKIS
jgi:hypothetical protein